MAHDLDSLQVFGVQGKPCAISRRSFLALSAVAAISSLVGCSSQGAASQTSSAASSADLAEIGETVFPNTVAENATISSEYADAAKELTESAFEYFRQIAKIPRKSEHLEGISSYIEQFATDYDYALTKDDAGNICFDVPASSGYESYPKVILQAHMDMVVSTSEDNTSFDPLTDAIHLVETEDVFKSDGTTNIGSDDGEGLCTLLAIAAADSSVFAHGPLRFMFTCDEDIGLVGASAMDSVLLDSDYLVNVDADYVGKVIYGAAGAMAGKFTQDCVPSVVDSDMTVLSVEVSGLAGGHSSLHATDTLLGANSVMRESMNAVASVDEGWRLLELTGGEIKNAIPNAASMRLCVSFDKAAEVKAKIEEAFQQQLAGYPKDADAKLIVSEDSAADNTEALSIEDTQNVRDLFNSLADGTIDSSFENQASCNISPVNITGGHVELNALFRAAKNETMKNAKDDWQSVAAKYAFDYSTEMDFPAWEQSADDSFVNLFCDELASVCAIKGKKERSAGGLEPSIFAQKRPGMQMVSIGADTEGEHVISETLYKKSFPVHMAVLMAALQDVDKL